MYHFITKKEYFESLEIKEIATCTMKNSHFGLKHVQDSLILSKILNLDCGNLAEIGGGISRTLSFLSAKGWKCSNIEPFQGAGNGPTESYVPSSIKNIKTYLGFFSPLLKESQFDLIYSISVIEHIHNEDLKIFFADMFRILKHGCMAWHAIDVYLRDEFDPKVAQRIAAVLKAATDAGFELIIPEDMPKAIFRCDYATNPDLVMRQWNFSVPALKDMRNMSQSVSLLMGLKK